MHPRTLYLFFFKSWNISETKDPPVLIRPWKKPAKEISVVLYLLLVNLIFFLKIFLKIKRLILKNLLII